MEAISPVVRGLLNGFSMGNMIQQQQMDQRRMQQYEDHEKFGREREQANILSQLAEMGARPVSASDEFEMDSGKHYGLTGLPSAPSLSATPTDLPSRILTIPGTNQRAVLPSVDEVDERKARVTQRSLLDRNRAQAEAHAERLKQDAAAQQQQLDATGVPIDGDLAKRFPGLFGKKVPASVYGQLARADATAQSRPTPGAPNPSKVSYVTNNENGNVTPIVPYLDADGNPQLRYGKAGEGLARPRPRGAGAAGKGEGGKTKLTATEKADELLGVVLRGTGSPDIEDAIKNVKSHFKNDPRFTDGVRTNIIRRLKEMADKSETNPLYQAQPTQAAPATAPKNPYK